MLNLYEYNYVHDFCWQQNFWSFFISIQLVNKYGSLSKFYRLDMLYALHDEDIYNSLNHNEF